MLQSIIDIFVLLVGIIRLIMLRLVLLLRWLSLGLGYIVSHGKRLQISWLLLSCLLGYWCLLARWLVSSRRLSLSSSRLGLRVRCLL